MVGAYIMNREEIEGSPPPVSPGYYNRLVAKSLSSPTIRYPPGEWEHT